MKVSDVTRMVLRSRREAKAMTASGYERIEGPWDMHSGARWDHVIADAKVAADGKSVFVRLEKGNPR